MKYDYERFINNNSNQFRTAHRRSIQAAKDVKALEVEHLKVRAYMEGKIRFYQERERELNRIATRWQERAVTLETRQQAIFCALEEAKSIREAFEKIDTEDSYVEQDGN